MIFLVIYFFLQAPLLIAELIVGMLPAINNGPHMHSLCVLGSLPCHLLFANGAYT